jgi:lipoprotein-anchoring transpeptidase ErfK/SrfK
MAVTVKRSPLARQIMFLFMAAGGMLLVIAFYNIKPLLPQITPLASRQAPVRRSPKAQNTKLVVDLSDRQVILYRHKQEIARYDVAIGQVGWETPIGIFEIHQMKPHPEWQNPITKEIIPSGDDNPLGDRWIGFYEGEHMSIGFHGTANESLVGSAVSHGCLRMRNRDIRSLYEQVDLGTRVEVQH